MYNSFKKILFIRQKRCPISFCQQRVDNTAYMILRSKLNLELMYVYVWVVPSYYLSLNTFIFKHNSQSKSVLYGGSPFEEQTDCKIIL